MRPISIFSIFCALCCLGFAASAQEEYHPRNPEPFGLWLAELRDEAVEQGIDASLADEALQSLKPLPRVIELDRKQPESTLTLEEYLQKVVPASRIEKARRLYEENRSLLKRTGAKYGVQPEYIVALWGIESSFGERQGDFSIVEALATLAYDGRRSEYFRGELLKSLRIVDAGHVSLDEMKGSWAGAMGQCQFMPTSFLNYAVDADGDGRKDIWDTRADVFASIANYLSREGWNKAASNNDKVLMRWNRSRYFVAAVNKLARAI